MANTLYEVRLTFEIGSNNPSTIVLRSSLPLESAVHLASSVWLSTDNDSLQVSVCENGESVPVITYRRRDFE